jgi:heme ABC exporter ATP-binding subunit CcmA
VVLFLVGKHAHRYPATRVNTVVELQSAVATVGRFPVIAGVDLSVQATEIVLLMGLNGAGKTSLLRVCSGLLAITSGRGTVLGHDLSTNRGSVRTSVGYLSQDSFLYDDLSVLENLRFWTRASRVEISDSAIRAALDRVGVAARLDHVAARQLSTGQRRRVSLAAVVLRRPQLWLLDEPHAGLDSGGRDLLDQLLVDAAAAGATVVFASHELDRAGEIATRVVTIAGGVVTDDQPKGSADAR